MEQLKELRRYAYRERVCSPAVNCSTVQLSNSKAKIKTNGMIDGTYIIVLASVRSVIQNYIVTFVYVIISMLIAFGFAWSLNKYANKLGWLGRFKWAKFIIKNRQVVLMCLSSVFLLVAGIGGLGWAIQTYDGTTPAEKLNKYIFLVLSYVGTFLMFVDIFLTALNDKHNSRR